MGGVGKNNEAKMLSVVQFLVEDHHADISLRTSDGKTAADMAKHCNQPQIEAYLRGKEREKREEESLKEREKREEELRKATAVSDAAREALLAELDAEEKTTTAASGQE